MVSLLVVSFKGELIVSGNIASGSIGSGNIGDVNIDSGRGGEGRKYLGVVTCTW